MLSLILSQGHHLFLPSAARESHHADRTCTMLTDFTKKRALGASEPRGKPHDKEKWAPVLETAPRCVGGCILLDTPHQPSFAKASNTHEPFLVSAHLLPPVTFSLRVTSHSPFPVQMHWGYHISQPHQTQACDGTGTCSCSSLHQTTFLPSFLNSFRNETHQHLSTSPSSSAHPLRPSRQVLSFLFPSINFISL